MSWLPIYPIRHSSYRSDRILRSYPWGLATSWGCWLRQRSIWYHEDIEHHSTQYRTLLRPCLMGAWPFHRQRPSRRSRGRHSHRMGDWTHRRQMRILCSLAWRSNSYPHPSSKSWSQRWCCRVHRSRESYWFHRWPVSLHRVNSNRSKILLLEHSWRCIRRRSGTSWSPKCFRCNSSGSHQRCVTISSLSPGWYPSERSGNYPWSHKWKVTSASDIPECWYQPAMHRWGWWRKTLRLVSTLIWKYSINREPP